METIDHYDAEKGYKDSVSELYVGKNLILRILNANAEFCLKEIIVLKEDDNTERIYLIVNIKHYPTELKTTYILEEILKED